VDTERIMLGELVVASLPRNRKGRFGAFGTPGIFPDVAETSDIFNKSRAKISNDIAGMGSAGMIKI
jgi:hypothetical protein